jgi:acyl-coenzyme A thioesterase PaaI-like protein
MNLLRPVTTGVLRAEGRVVHAGRSQILAEAVLTDDAGKQVARGSGTFVRGVTPLSADIGYKD